MFKSIKELFFGKWSEVMRAEGTLAYRNVYSIWDEKVIGVIERNSRTGKERAYVIRINGRQRIEPEYMRLCVEKGGKW